jgi:hypothetical protein
MQTVNDSSNSMTTIALVGAGGKMGCRIADHLQHDPACALRYVERSERGLANLANRGLKPTPSDAAVAEADVIILAVPDTLLGKVAREIIHKLKPGAMITTLDPAAAHAGELPARPAISIFVTHPCHPSVFELEDDLEARADFFGGTKARMPIVCALMLGPEAHYALGDELARKFYAPVTRSHRITVEQMAMLEPAMAETVTAMLCTVIKEAMDEAISRGVPPEAARDFMLGHVNIPLAIVFGEAGNPFSDGAKLFIEYGRERVLRADWKAVFEPESVKEQVRRIVGG